MTEVRKKIMYPEDAENAVAVDEEIKKALKKAIAPHAKDEIELNSLIEEFLPKAKELYAKAGKMGLKMSLIFKPAKKKGIGFFELLDHLHSVRVLRGHRGVNPQHLVLRELWRKFPERFNSFGMNTEPQLVGLLVGPGKGGLFFAGLDANEQIRLGDEFVAANDDAGWLLEADYVYYDIAAAFNHERLLGMGTATLFVHRGWFNMPACCCVTYAYLRYLGRLEFGCSRGLADSSCGVRFVVKS